jgi:uncharacterized protein (TIGR03067 family)
MMRLIAAVTAGLVVAGAGSAQPQAKSIDGEYRVRSAVFDGKADNEKLAKATVEIKDGSLAIRTGEKVESADFKLDPSKSPAQIDLRWSRIDGRPVPVKGIYQSKTTPDGLELTLAYTMNQGERPTDFLGEGKGTVVLKLLRSGAK